MPAKNKNIDVIFYCSEGDRWRALVLLNAALKVSTLYNFEPIQLFKRPQCFWYILTLNRVHKSLYYFVHISYIVIICSTSNLFISPFFVRRNCAFYGLQVTFLICVLLFVSDSMVLYWFLTLVFVLFIWIFHPIPEFSFIWRRHHYRIRALNFDLYSARMAIEQLEFFSAPHLLWHGTSVCNGHLRGPVTLTSVAERWSCYYPL